MNGGNSKKSTWRYYIQLATSAMQSALKLDECNDMHLANASLDIAIENIKKAQKVEFEK